jgi:hypothetical protein
MSAPNPFESPLSPALSPEHDTGAPATARMLDALRKTRFFAMMLAACGFAWSVLRLLSLMGHERLPRLAALLELAEHEVIAVVILVAYGAIPALFLILMCRQIGGVLEAGDLGLLPRVLRAQKRFWLAALVLAVAFLAVTLWLSLGIFRAL